MEWRRQSTRQNCNHITFAQTLTFCFTISPAPTTVSNALRVYSQKISVIKLSSHDAQLHVKPASECHLLGKVPQVISGLVYVTMKICYEGFNHLLSRKRILEGRDLRVFKISRCSLTILRNCSMRFGQGASLSIVQARWHCAPLACARDVTPVIFMSLTSVLSRGVSFPVSPRESNWQRLTRALALSHLEAWACAIRCIWAAPNSWICLKSPVRWANLSS